MISSQQAQFSHILAYSRIFSLILAYSGEKTEGGGAWPLIQPNRTTTNGEAIVLSRGGDSWRALAANSRFFPPKNGRARPPVQANPTKSDQIQPLELIPLTLIPLTTPILCQAKSLCRGGPCLII
jgi:hypothetical protein